MLTDEIIIEWPDDSFDLEETFQYKVIQGTLFKSDPLPEDIYQSSIGDCFLLAVLQNAAERMPAQIINMIQDEGNGKVLVRMFDLNLNPVTFRIDKTKLVSKVKSKEIAAHKNDWVYLLEKAYAAHAIMIQGCRFIPKKDVTLESGQLVTVDDPSSERLAKTQFEALSGGDFTDAYKFLFAYIKTDILFERTEMEEVLLSQVQNDEENQIIKLMEHGSSLLNHNENDQKIMEDLNEIFKKIFGNSNCTEVENFKNKYSCDVLTAFCEEKQKDDKFFNYPDNVDDFLENHMSDLYEETKKKIINYARAHRALFQRGIPTYSSRTEETYKQIYNELKQGHQVLASTKNNIGRYATNREVTNEPIVKGLAGGHVYRVVNIEKTDRGFILVHLGNPWGVGNLMRGYHAITKPDGQMKLKAIPVINNGPSFFNQALRYSKKALQEMGKTEASALTNRCEPYIGTFPLEIKDLRRFYRICSFRNH